MRIAAYCRVSTDKEEQLESLKNQKEFFTEYAIKNGHSLIKLYSDEGISGKQKNNRLQFLQMISDAKEHMFDMIVTKDISRFSRNTVDTLTTIRELKDLGVEVLFLTNNQTILGHSEFVITLFSALAQEESANLSKRVKFGKNKVGKNGIVPNFIYGYTRIDKYKLEINEQQARVVRIIFDLYVNHGYGCSKITNYLIDNNIPSYKGDCQMWNTKTVRRILRNNIYIGIVSNNKSEVVNFLTGKTINKKEEDWYNTEYPEISIIDKDLFYKAQELFDRRQELYKNKFPNGRFCDKYLFSGIIKCTHCGRSFTRKSYTYKNTRIYWVCPLNDHYSKRKCINNFTINESDIIDYLETNFQEILKNKDKYIEEYIVKFYDNLEKNNLHSKEAEQIKKNVESDKNKRERLLDLYTNNLISMDDLKVRTTILDNLINENESKISNLEKYANQAAHIRETAEYIVTSIEKLSNVEVWSNFTIKEIIDKIEIYVDGNIEIFFREQ